MTTEQAAIEMAAKKMWLAFFGIDETRYNDKLWERGDILFGTEKFPPDWPTKADYLQMAPAALEAFKVSGIVKENT